MKLNNNSSMFRNASFVAVVMLSTMMIISSSNVNDVEAQRFPCAPASHCDPRSQLCISTNEARALLASDGEREDTDPIPSRDTARGVCTDAFRWICNKQGTQCRQKDYTREEIETRCQNILFTDRSRRSSVEAKQFIEACEAGRYTCNDGSCVLNAGQCNRGGRGGVRYDKARCEIDSCGDEFILEDKCRFKEQREEQGGASTALEANIECKGNRESSLRECCPTDANIECEFLPVATDKIDLEPAECGNVCPPETCPKPHPYWAEGGPNGGTVVGGGQEVGAGGEEENPLLRDVSGIELSWDTTRQGESSCCCRLSCDCFGDPHCTDFFANQETSKISEGSYTMYQQGEFSYELELGPPMGILTDAYFTVHGHTRRFRLDHDHCNNETHNWRDYNTGEFLSRDQLPESWTIRWSQGDFFTDPSVHVVRDLEAEVSVEVKCVDFFWLTNPRSNNLIPGTRIDTTVTKWSDLSGEGCCPTEAEHRQWFDERDASGYCVEERPLPQSLPNGRRLAEESSFGLKPDKYGVVRGALGEQEFEEDPEQFTDETVELLCETYLELINSAGITAIAALSEKDKCVENVLDFGVLSMQRLIQRLQLGVTCIVDINDRRLLRPFDACESGFTLQIKSPNDDDFRDWRFFRAGDRFCANKILIDFSRAYDAEEETFLSTEYQFQIKRCSPDPELCGSCDSLMGFESINFRYTYECPTYTAYKGFALQGLYNALRDGTLSCGFAHRGNSDPLSCLKKRFPDLFGIPSGESPLTQSVSGKGGDEQSEAELPSKRCGEIKNSKVNCERFPWCRWTKNGKCRVKGGR